MDKSRNGNTIKIKINGKDSPFKEGQNGATPAKQKKEPPNSERLQVTESVEQSAATKETHEDGEKFDWILPSGTALPKTEESNIIYLKEKKKEKLVKPITDFFKKTKSSKKVQLKAKASINGIKNIKNMKWINSTMLLAIVFAIILGSFFGLILLELVPSNQAVGGEQTTAVNEETTDQPIVNESIEAVLKPLSFAVVQAGIYTSQSSAEAIVVQVKENGTPAEIIPTAGKFAIFVSVAASLAEAKTIGKEIEGNGLTIFSKEVTIDEKKINLKHEEEKKLLELSPKLYKALTASATTAGISNSIPAAVMKSVADEGALFSKIDKEKLEHKGVIEIYSHLEVAVVQLKQYEKNSDGDSLNKLQQSLLSFLASYQSLE